MNWLFLSGNIKKNLFSRICNWLVVCSSSHQSKNIEKYRRHTDGQNLNFSVVISYLNARAIELNPLHHLSCYIYRFPILVNETVQLIFSYRLLQLLVISHSFIK